MSQDPAFDASIPVLTEIVREPAAPLAPSTQQQSALPDDWPAQLERRAIDRWSGAEWSVLERRVTERILQQLQGRIDFAFEQRLRAGVTQAVEQALNGFASEIQASVEANVRELVQRAVSSEIAHIQTLGK